MKKTSKQKIVGKVRQYHTRNAYIKRKNPTPEETNIKRIIRHVGLMKDMNDFSIIITENEENIKIIIHILKSYFNIHVIGNKDVINELENINPKKYDAIVICQNFNKIYENIDPTGLSLNVGRDLIGGAGTPVLWIMNKKQFINISNAGHLMRTLSTVIYFDEEW